MKPAPSELVACPHCEAPARVLAARSAKTWLALRWTDGAFEPNPNLAKAPDVGRCPGCKRFFWLDAAPRPKELPETARLPALALPGPDDLYEAIEAGLAPERADEVRLRRLAFQADNDALRGQRESLGLGLIAALVGALCILLAIHRIVYGSTIVVVSMLFGFSALVLFAVGTSDVVSARRHRAGRLRAQQARKAGSGPFFSNLRSLFERLDENDPDERLLKAEAARELGDFERALSLLSHPWPEPLAPIAKRIRSLAEARDAVVASVPEP